MFLLVGHEKNVIYSKLVNNPYKENVLEYFVNNMKLLLVVFTCLKVCKGLFLMIQMVEYHVYNIYEDVIELL